MAKENNGAAAKVLIAMIVMGIAAACGAWATHIQSKGHPVTLQKVETIQEDVAEIKVDVKTLLRSNGGTN